MQLTTWTPSSPLTTSFALKTSRSPAPLTQTNFTTPAPINNGHSGESVTLSNNWAPPTGAPISTEPPAAIAPTPAYQPPAGTTGPLLLEEPSWLQPWSSSPAPSGPSLAEQHLDQKFHAHSFNNKFKDAGWKMRDGAHDDLFRVSNLAGREVAFQRPDESGKLVEHRGVIEKQPDGAFMSALFTLQGQEGEFNANLVGEMALKPLEPKPSAAAGLSFQTRYEEAGWKVRQENNDTRYWASSLNEREVAFVTFGRDGRPVEHRGVLQQSGDNMSSLFTLRDQPGQFNANFLTDMAVRPRQPDEQKRYGSVGI